MIPKDDENDYEEGEGDSYVLPHYQRPCVEQWGCLGIIWKFCVHFVVTHIALVLCLGVIVLGGEVCVKGIISLGWHSVVAVVSDVLIVLAYIAVVIGVVTLMSRLGKKITKDEQF